MIEKTYFELNDAMEAIKAAEKLDFLYSLEKELKIDEKPFKTIHAVYRLTIHLED